MREGLQTLERIARALSDDVWIIAPEMDQSGVSHSLTLSDPLRLREVSKRHFALRGTPTDCVMMGVKHLMQDELPDLVLSGVNRGSNLADDVTYSGTMAGAMEGTLLGIPLGSAVAELWMLEGGSSAVTKWRSCMLPLLSKNSCKSSWPAHVLMNINFPDVEPDKVKGTLFTKQGKYPPDQQFIEERRDGRGFPYYWIMLRPREHDLLESTDLKAVSGRLCVGDAAAA